MNDNDRVHIVQRGFSTANSFYREHAISKYVSAGARALMSMRSFRTTFTQNTFYKHIVGAYNSHCVSSNSASVNLKVVLHRMWYMQNLFSNSASVNLKVVQLNNMECVLCRMCSQTQLASISRSRLIICISSIVQIRYVGDSCLGRLIVWVLIDPVQWGTGDTQVGVDERQGQRGMDHF